MTHTPAELFASAAPFYARYRPGYDPRFYSLLELRLSSTPGGRLLDLGAGTGEIARRLAPAVGTVHAVDPEPGMLTEGQRLADEQGLTNIVWQEGDSTTLTTMALGPVDMVTMGKSFHWMDRVQVAADLDQIITPSGALVIVSDGHPEQRPRDPWEDVVDQVRTRYLGPARRAGSGTYEHPAESHEEVLARSPFSRVDTIRWDRTIPRTLDEIVGLQFSYSFSTPAMFGDQREAFEQDLRQALTDHQPDGKFTEHIRTEAVIALRP